MTKVAATKSADETKAEKSNLGRTVVYSHCSAIKPDADKPAILSHSDEQAGIIVAEKVGSVDIHLIARGRVVENVAHVTDVKADATAKHAYRFTSR